MSAFICSDKHIRAVAQGFELFGTGMIEGYDLDSLCQDLLDQNYNSVNARYGEAQLPPPLKYKRVFVGDDPEKTKRDLLMLIQSYRYQSSEDDGWDDCFVNLLTETLSNKLLESLNLTRDDIWKFTDSPWVI